MPVTTSAPTAPADGGSSQTWIALGIGALALLGAGWFLFGRRRRRDDEDDAVDELVLDAPLAAPPPRARPAPAPAAAPPPPPPPPPPRDHLTIPLRRAPEPPASPPGLLTVPLPRAPAAPLPGIERGEPVIEIELIPQRAGTDPAMHAAVEYRIRLRNVGGGTARDIAFGIYMLSASARQASDLQQIFAAPVDKPVVPSFELVPGAEVELSGTAMIPRENVNVMTIDGKPWFVPVLAMKAEYRWGENVGAPGSATAAHMIGINRGEGAKMQPFRLDGDPRMHPKVAERRVA